MVVHGDDFTFCGLEEDLLWISKLMGSWFDIKVRGMLGPDDKDVEQIVILGRIVRWTPEGLEWEADPKHRKLILEYFGFDQGSRSLKMNGDKDEREEEWDSEELEREEPLLGDWLRVKIFLALIVRSFNLESSSAVGKWRGRRGDPGRR